MHVCKGIEKSASRCDHLCCSLNMACYAHSYDALCYGSSLDTIGIDTSLDMLNHEDTVCVVTCPHLSCFFQLFLGWH